MSMNKYGDVNDMPNTSYFLISDGAEKEYYSLRDAKEAAEKL